MKTEADKIEIERVKSEGTCKPEAEQRGVRFEPCTPLYELNKERKKMYKIKAEQSNLHFETVIPLYEIDKERRARIERLEMQRYRLLSGLSENSRK